MRIYHLAQLNVARALAPLDAPEMASFVAELDRINALADGAPGFVWRFQTEDGNATALRAWDDPRILVNFSVWESPEALHHYTYRTAHVEVMARRREWFARVGDASLVLWWVPAGHRPTLQEGIARLESLRQQGSTPEAFTFKQPFPPPGETGSPDPAALPDECPAS